MVEVSQRIRNGLFNFIYLNGQVILTYDPNGDSIILVFAYFLSKDLCLISIPFRAGHAAGYMSKNLSLL